MIIKVFRKIFRLISLLFKPMYFGFIQDTYNLNKYDFHILRKKIGKKDDITVRKYEKEFKGLIGDGEILSYATARMGFYHVLKTIGIGEGDEVILLGFTCSVMANAVLRSGAKPVYSDVDPNTLGSSITNIKPLVTQHTKAIVAQHSFGIPCDVEDIVKFSKENNIFLIEDSAITLSSKLNGIFVGNFGDVSIFSTDHTKPFNTMIGGFVFSKNLDLINNLRNKLKEFPIISIEKQKRILNQIIFENKYCKGSKYKFFKIFTTIKNIIFRFNPRYLSPFLDEDGGITFNTSYPYPSPLPLFISILGLLRIKTFNEQKRTKEKILRNYVEFFKDNKFDVEIPRAYFDKSREIVPLRFVFFSSDYKLIEKLNKIIDFDWFWFKEPIISTDIELNYFGYDYGSCKNSESIGNKIINLPCNISLKQQQDIFSYLE